MPFVLRIDEAYGGTLRLLQFMRFLFPFSKICVHDGLRPCSQFATIFVCILKFIARANGEHLEPKRPEAVFAMRLFAKQFCDTAEEAGGGRLSFCRYTSSERS